MQVENIWIWRFAVLFFFLSIAWIQGVNTPVFLKNNPIVSGILNTLILNVMVIYILGKHLSFSDMFPYIFVLVPSNIIIACFGYKFASDAIKDDDGKKSLIVFSTSSFILPGISVIFWSIIGLLSKI